eukprot:363910-Chlamydomonas_euryale.AAC.19
MACCGRGDARVVGLRRQETSGGSAQAGDEPLSGLSPSEAGIPRRCPSPPMAHKRAVPRMPGLGPATSPPQQHTPALTCAVSPRHATPLQPVPNKT